MNLLTVTEAAARLRCSRRKVFELIAQGILIRGARYGRSTVVTEESVEAALTATPAEPRVVIPKRRIRRAVGGARSVDDWLARVRAS